MRVAVTGANGFIGPAVVRALLAHGQEVVALTRRLDPALALPGVENRATGPIEAVADWTPLLMGTDAVVHLAGRAHVATSDLEIVSAINTIATITLAEAAARRSARRFVFVSSIKVLGEQTPIVDGTPRPFRGSEPLAPEDAYARSKAEAEIGLQDISDQLGLPVVFLRPPLVHGPGAKANFRRLLDLVARSSVLPLGAIHNQRSLVSVDNLASAIVTCLTHPRAGGRRLVVSDGEDPSTPTLVRLIAEGLHRRVLLAPVPVGLLRVAGRLTGASQTVARLVDSLQVDPSELIFELGWRPVETLREGLARTIASYRTETSPRKKIARTGA